MHRGGEERGASARQRDRSDEYDDGHHGKYEDAALWSRAAAAHPRGAERMRGEQTVRAGGTAVSNTEEKRLRPVPRSVQADGPPQRTCTPQAECKHQARAAGAEKADRRLARIQAVQRAEAEGDNHRCTPEADRLRVTIVWRDVADQSCQAFSKVELQIATEEKLLEEADAEERDCPHEAVAHCRKWPQQNTGERQMMRAPQRQDEQRLED